MSWYTKLSWITAPVLLVLGANANAQRIEFGGADSKANLTTRVLRVNAEVAPLELHLTVPAIDVDRDRDGFSAVDAAGLDPMNVIGNPDLFATGSLIAVPDGFQPVLQVVTQDERTVNDIVVRPSQKKFRCATPEREGFQFNASLYSDRAAYPANVADLEEVGHLQGLRLMRVAMHPMRLLPADRKLTVTTDLVVRVTFNRVGEAKTVRLTRPFFELARTVTANGASLGQFLRAETAPETMLIFVADSLKASIAPLAEWKRSKGINVQVFTATDAGGTNDAIKKFIKTYADANGKPTYLLFVGNNTTMPTFMESTASGSAASDWQYSLLGGQENIPDAFYGRLAADDENDVNVQVSRWIAYEKTPEAGASWYPQATTIASNEGSGPSDKEYAGQIQTALKAGTYKVADGFYQGEQTATVANISGSLNEGRTWIAYFGHGSGTSWGSTNDSFNVSTVGTLTNADKLPVIIDVACQNGSWVKINKCFGKAWVTQTADGKNAGAVSFLGGSVNISWHEPAVMSVGVAKYHFEKQLYTLGASVLAGQLYLIEKMGTGSNTLDNMKWYNLLGDPSLYIRTNTPAAYELKHSVKKVGGNRVEVAITTVDGSGKAVSGIIASVNANAGSPLAVGKTDQNGQATLAISGVSELEPNTVLTTTGYNAETKQTVLK